jgi:hypothetical protein
VVCYTIGVVSADYTAYQGVWFFCLGLAMVYFGALMSSILFVALFFGATVLISRLFRRFLRD